MSVAENTREGIATIAAGALTLNLGLASTDGTAVVDWGDGTRTTIGYTGSTYQNYGHTYAVAGTYVVRFINYKKIKALRVTTQQLSVSITGTSLTYLTLSGTGSAVTGVQSELCRLTRQYYFITNDITIPSSNLVYGTWGSEAMRIEMATKLPAAMTDYVLQRLATATISGANKTVYLKAEARTSASDAAYATLQAAGVTVTITG